jgi:parallel beta-helix repeat protein
MKTIKKPFTALAIKCLAIPLFAILFMPQFSYADDTALVQGLITNGTAFPTGKTYTVSTSLTVNKSVNFNGDIINYVGTAGGCLLIKSPGVVIQNGTIQGTFTPTAVITAGSGPSGITIYADNVTVTKMTIQNITNYGIVVTAGHVNPIITYNKIINTGFISFFYDSEAATTGGTLSFNIIDRSQIPSASVHQPAIAIRGAGAGTSPVTTGWTIASNTISMPLNPTDWSSEGIEVRAMTNSTVTGNTFNQSTISISLVRCTGIIVSNNKCNGAQLEGIEIADSNNSICSNNVITGGIGLGYLIDGPVGSNGTTISGDKISGTAKDCIQAVAGAKNIKIVNATLAAGTNAKALNLAGTTGVTVTGSIINGNNSAGQTAVYLTNCAGNLTINGATITNFAKCLLYISNSTTGLVTDNISVTGNTVTGVTTPMGSYLLNGSKVGTNVKVTLQ